MIKAFRDTWELGIHSYLTYLRDRLLVAKELLTESGSCFVQISDENVHLVRSLMDEVFKPSNFISTITFRKTNKALGAKLLGRVTDYIVWYAKEKEKVKFRNLHAFKTVDSNPSSYKWVQTVDGQRRQATIEDIEEFSAGTFRGRFFTPVPLTSSGYTESCTYSFKFNGAEYTSATGKSWVTTKNGMENLIAKNRLFIMGSTPFWIQYLEELSTISYDNIWDDTRGELQKTYVVQTTNEVIKRCMLMTTDPGDLVFDPTCGSGTTADVAEQWGRRWITCDTSRVAITLAKQRLMTAVFDYYKLAHQSEGVSSGFQYKTVPHITLKSIANNEPAGEETLYDQPYPDNSKTRVAGPFTVEAVPAPSVKPLGQVDSGQWLVDSGGKKVDSGEWPVVSGGMTADNSVVRSGETLRQSEWRDELLKTGIRGKGGQRITFSRVEALGGTRWLNCDAETKEVVSGQWLVDSEEKKKELKSNHQPLTPQRVVISFGPEHCPLEQRQVALAIEEAQNLVPKPRMVVFAAFQFDPEAAKDIDETNWPGVALLKVQMNADMLTDDLKKKRSSNESFWLIGQPDVRVDSDEWLVDSKDKRIILYDICKELSGFNSLAEINRIGRGDLSFYAAIAERRDLWIKLTDEKSGGVDSVQHSRGTGSKQYGGISAVSGDSERFACRIGDAVDFVGKIRLLDREERKRIIGELFRNKQIAERASQFSVHCPLTTKHFAQVALLGFDYYNTRTGNIDSGGTEKIAMWMLDTDYDGRSIFAKQVFFPMAGENEGWTKLAKSLKAEIDEELIEAYKGTVSLPFEVGENKRIAIKIVDDRGIESLKIISIG